MSNLNINEKRKQLIQYYSAKGTSTTKIAKMHDRQIYAVYAKCEPSIREYNYLVAALNYNVEKKVTERDYWSDKEWDDYAFEERD